MLKKIFLRMALAFSLWTMAGAASASELEVTVLDVGQGLAVCCSCDGHFMMYDGGGRDTSSRVVRFLQEKGAGALDYAVVSHYDDDHLSGVIGALHVFDTGLVLSPDYIGNTSIYTSFREWTDEKGIPCEAPAVGNIYPLGSAVIETLGPDDYLAEKENDRCVAVRVSLGNTSVILCGDAQEAEEAAIAAGPMRPGADVYVANHHGSASSGTDPFLDWVSPDYAVISCGLGNDFGHPSAAALERLSDRGIRIYRTDLQGDISLRMDGETILFEKEPTTDLTPGTASGEDPESGPGQTGCRYVCNFRTFVFHRPACETVSRMSETNKVYSNDERAELIALGYSPCGVCCP